MFRVYETLLTGGESDVLFPHIAVSHMPTVVAATLKMLYRDRVSAAKPLIVYEDYYFVEEPRINSITFVRDTSITPDKPYGKEVAHAAILQKYRVTVKAYSDSEKNSGVIQVGNADTHYALALLPQLTPWYFKDKPLTDWEKKMLMSLLLEDSKEFMKYVMEYMERIHLETSMKKIRLKNFFSGLLDAKMESFRREEELLWSDIRSLEESINAKMAQLTEVSAILLGIKTSHNDEGLNQFVEVLEHNNNINVVRCDRGTMDLNVCGFLTNFKMDKYKSISRSMDSIMYKNVTPSGMSKHELHELYDQIVLGSRYKVNLCAQFRVNFKDNTVSLQRTSSTQLHPNAVPNPHVAHYTCSGGFGAMYREAFRAGDYLDLLDVMFSEVQNINFTDVSPVQKFAADFCGYYWNQPVIWDNQDNVFITPADLAARMKKENEDHEQE